MSDIPNDELDNLAKAWLWCREHECKSSIENGEPDCVKITDIICYLFRDHSDEAWTVLLLLFNAIKTTHQELESKFFIGPLVDLQFHGKQDLHLKIKKLAQSDSFFLQKMRHYFTDEHRFLEDVLLINES